MNIDNYQISYSENHEDIILAGFFDKNIRGFYVDVGANHPEDKSITKLFYDMGWHGINIEPIPRLYKLFEKQRFRDINLNIGVSDQPGILTFRDYINNDKISSFIINKNYNNQKYKNYSVQVKPLKQIFIENNVRKINFLNIDVEGYEYEVLSGNNWSIYRPQVICIDSTDIIKNWKSILLNNSYILFFFDGLNEYYVDKNEKSLSENFSYVKAIIEKQPIQSDVYKNIVYLNNYSANLENDRQTLINENARLNQENQILISRINQQQRLRYIAKNLLLKINTIILIKISSLNNPEIPEKKLKKYLNQNNEEKLLKQLRSYDFDNYFNTRQTTLRYRFVLFLYNRFKVTVINILKKIILLKNNV